jgi:hypothetical protein
MKPGQDADQVLLAYMQDCMDRIAEDTRLRSRSTPS